MEKQHKINYMYNKGITLIALIITIIILLILARSHNSNISRRQWDNRKSRRGKIQNRIVSSCRRIRFILSAKTLRRQKL